MSQPERDRIVNLLVIGQTPPPHVGQALTIQSIVQAWYPDVRIYHTRMNYSHSVSEIGRFKISKAFHLWRVMLESGWKICRYGIEVIYYPPGADTIPIIRDIITLLWLRLFRRKLILVFHAGGLSQKVASWTGLRRRLFNLAFLYPDAAVQKSRLNPPDADFVRAKKTYYMPNGAVDQLATVSDSRPENPAPVILFVGMVRADKGIDTLVEAAALLQQQNRNFRIRIVGEFASDQYRQALVRKVAELGLAQCIELCGRKVGIEKWTAYRCADIFCFPTYYGPETFGNVLLEAMMFELPTVSTRWRAIPDIVVEGETGFLVEIKDAEALSERLARLLDDKNLRVEMGRKGRERYLANFTTDIYLQRNREVFLEVAGTPGPRESRARESGEALFAEGRAEKNASGAV